MSDPAIGGLGALALVVLLLLQVPIGFAMMAVGVIGYAVIGNWATALTIITSEPSAILTSVDLATVPLFLLMGTFASAAGFSTDLYNAAATFLGHRRGGLAYATVAGSTAFGAVCGSSAATAATFTKAALPEMLARDYEPGFSAATIAAGGTLKSLIPPSTTMVLYCIVANAFILDMFVAAIVPAALTVLLNLLAIAIVVHRRPGVAPVSAHMPWRERWPVIIKAIPATVLIVVVFAGLYGGVFTVNEAASVAAVLSLVFALASGRMNWALFWGGLRSSASATAMIYVILIGATVFSYFLTLARVPDLLIHQVGASHLPPLAIIFLLLLTYLVLGAVFDEIAAMVITLPLVLPIILQLGYDPLWWGIVNVVIIELGMIIPPVGMIVFVIHGLNPRIPLSAIYRNVMPFILANLTVLVLLTLFPQIALWLPHQFQ